MLCLLQLILHFFLSGLSGRVHDATAGSSDDAQILAKLKQNAEDSLASDLVNAEKNSALKHVRWTCVCVSLLRCSVSLC